MRGNPSQEMNLDERVIKANLVMQIKKYERTRDPKLKNEIEKQIQFCFDRDINVSREKRIFDKIQ